MVYRGRSADITLFRELVLEKLLTSSVDIDILNNFHHDWLMNDGYKNRSRILTKRCATDDFELNEYIARWPIRILSDIAI